jgi:hypothetical protein
VAGQVLTKVSRPHADQRKCAIPITACAGWTENTADTGLIVNGANVLATGLFVEHYQKYNVVWNGQNGKTIFFKNKMPYDVTTHETWGMGSYCNFDVNPAVNALPGFEVPQTAGVTLHDTLTASLGGEGTISHVINTTRAAAAGASTIPVNVVSYP